MTKIGVLKLNVFNLKILWYFTRVELSLVHSIHINQTGKMLTHFNRISLISSAVVTLFACSGPKQEAPQIEPDVMVVPVISKTLAVYGEYVGEVYGKADVAIQSRIEGWISGIHFKEGTVVQKGQLLYTLTDEPARNHVNQAKAHLAEAKTMMVKAKSDLDRVEPLANMKALSQRELDAAKAMYNASVNEVEAAEAALANANIELGYTRIVAPITGIIGISKLQVGDFVSMVNLGAPLNTVSTVETVRVRFTITEEDYLAYARRKKENGDFMVTDRIPIELMLSDGTAYEEKGSIDITNREIDPQTGSFMVQAVFANRKGLLRPGQYVKVKLQVDQFKDAVFVPQQSIIQIQNKYQTYVIDDSSKLRVRMVNVGKRIGSNWLINDGLKVGEKVAIVGSVMLRPDMVVVPKLLSWNSDSTDIQ